MTGAAARAVQPKSCASFGKIQPDAGAGRFVSIFGILFEVSYCTIKLTVVAGVRLPTWVEIVME
jgi:hypothetical protein